MVAVRRSNGHTDVGNPPGVGAPEAGEVEGHGLEAFQGKRARKSGNKV